MKPAFTLILLCTVLCYACKKNTTPADVSGTYRVHEVSLYRSVYYDNNMNIVVDSTTVDSVYMIGVTYTDRDNNTIMLSKSPGYNYQLDGNNMCTVRTGNKTSDISEQLSLPPDSFYFYSNSHFGGNYELVTITGHRVK